MFGFLLGTLCLIGLVRVITRRHWGHRHGHWHGRGYHGGFGPRYALHRVLARLDAAPGQEKVITAAVTEFIDQARESGREVFGQHDAALDRVRRASVEAMRKVHEALDERQRRVLGDLFESGFYGLGQHGCGSYC